MLRWLVLFFFSWLWDEERVADWHGDGIGCYFHWKRLFFVFVFGEGVIDVLFLKVNRYSRPVRK